MRSLAADLAGRSGPVFVAHLDRQLVATGAAAELVGRLLGGELTAEQARTQVRELEHQGDLARQELVGALAHTLTSPIDRADLFRVSRSIDDVLDNLRDLVRQVDLFDLTDLSPCAPLVPPISAALAELRRAVAALAVLGPDLPEATLRAGKAGNLIRRRYDEQLAALLRAPLDGTVLMHREVLRRLDVVGLRIGEAAAGLADGYMKRR